MYIYAYKNRCKKNKVNIKVFLTFVIYKHKRDIRYELYKHDRIGKE